MEKAFILNPFLKPIDIKDALDEKITKIKGILNCLMFATEFIESADELDQNTIYHTLWVIDEFLDEIYLLRQKLNES